MMAGDILDIKPVDMAGTMLYFRNGIDAVAKKSDRHVVLSYLSVILTGFAFGKITIFGTCPLKTLPLSDGGLCMFPSLREAVDWYAKNRFTASPADLENIGRHVLFHAGFLRLERGPQVIETGMGAFARIPESNLNAPLFSELAQDLEHWQVLLSDLREHFRGRDFDGFADWRTRPAASA